MPRVEIPAPADLVIDPFGNALLGYAVTLKLAGTGTNATHWSALTGGTSTTGGLFTSATGTIVNGSGNRRYVASGVALDITINGLARQVEPLSAAVENDVTVIKEAPLNVMESRFGALGNGSNDDTTEIQAALDLAATATDGGDVLIPSGVFVRGDLVLKSGVTLQGTGRDSILKTSGSTGGVIRNENHLGDGSNIDTGIMVKHLTIDGNRGALGDANYFGLLLTNLTDFLVDDVYIKSCKRIGINLGGDSSSSDGLASRGVIRACQVTDIGDTAGVFGVGIAVIRGEHIVIEDTFAWANITHGIDLEPNQADSVVRDIAIKDVHAWGNGNSGICLYNASASQNTDVVGNVSIVRARCDTNTHSGIHLFGFVDVTVDDCRSRSNTLDGIRVDNYNLGLKIHNSTLRGNTGAGLNFTNAVHPVAQVRGNTMRDNTNWGIKNAAASTFWLRMDDNIVYGNTAGQVSLTQPSTNGKIWRSGNMISAASPTGDPNVVASAATLTLPEFETNEWYVSGTTTTTTITASWVDRRITLRATGNWQITAGSNLKMAGNFAGTALDTISFISDGVNWIELGRSVNA